MQCPATRRYGKTLRHRAPSASCHRDRRIGGQDRSIERVQGLGSPMQLSKDRIDVCSSASSLDAVDERTGSAAQKNWFRAYSMD